MCWVFHKALGQVSLPMPCNFAILVVEEVKNFRKAREGARLAIKFESMNLYYHCVKHMMRKRFMHFPCVFALLRSLREKKLNNDLLYKSATPMKFSFAQLLG